MRSRPAAKAKPKPKPKPRSRSSQSRKPIGKTKRPAKVPLPPDSSKSDETRYINIREGDPLDEAQMMMWVKQAATLPGWLDSPKPEKPRK